MRINILRELPLQGVLKRVGGQKFKQWDAFTDYPIYAAPQKTVSSTQPLMHGLVLIFEILLLMPGYVLSIRYIYIFKYTFLAIIAYIVYDHKSQACLDKSKLELYIYIYIYIYIYNSNIPHFPW